MWRRKSGSAAIGDVQQHVGLDGLDQRAVERRHQVVRQLADEAHRVGEQHHLAVRAHELARGGVERGEEPVLHEHAGARERVEESALARVRVADERGAELTPAAHALRLALALHACSSA
jgi:hypothetical protein